MLVLFNLFKIAYGIIWHMYHKSIYFGDLTSLLAKCKMKIQKIDTLSWIWWFVYSFNYEMYISKHFSFHLEGKLQGVTFTGMSSVIVIILQLQVEKSINFQVCFLINSKIMYPIGSSVSVTLPLHTCTHDMISSGGQLYILSIEYSVKD